MSSKDKAKNAAKQRALRAKWTPEQKEARRIYDNKLRAKLRQDAEHIRKRDEYQAEYRLRTKYGLSVAERDAMLETQDGHCALCPRQLSFASKRRHGGSAHVDHCHQTGAIRGILCEHCNMGLGKFGDSVESIQRVLDYLQKTLAGKPKLVPNLSSGGITWQQRRQG